MSAPQLPPGSVVASRYQVRAPLGAGGASVTYLAASADGREVVLKLFDPSLRQRGDIMASIEQAYAATNALPPEIGVPLLDAGYDPGTGAPFSVVERMTLPSLAQLVASRPLGLEDCARTVAAIATALEQGHRRGLYHHALKPTNVFLASPQAPLVRLADFAAGLARAAVPTQEGYAIAAPWLAPEQLQQAPAGEAADVFALALVAFYTLTGRSFWLSCQGALDLASWQQELFSQRPAASARAAQLGVHFPATADAAFASALSVDPSQRPRTPSEFARALEMAVGQPTEQATMAFPSSALGLPATGDYPPPPPPMGGYQEAPRPIASAYPTVQQPYGVPASPPIPQAPTPPPYGAQPATGAVAHAVTAFDETSVGKPALTAVNVSGAKASRLVPIVVGALGVVTLSAAIGAWYVIGHRGEDASATSPTGVTSAASAPSPASVAPTAVAAPPAPSNPATSAAPPSASVSAEASSSASADPAAAGSSSPATLTCDPDCDEIKVDDAVVDTTKPLTLAPGKHVVVASKAGYIPDRETIVVKPGEKFEQTFKLKIPLPVGSGNAATLPKCGKFLHRGAGCR